MWQELQFKTVKAPLHIISSRIAYCQHEPLFFCRKSEDTEPRALQSDSTLTLWPFNMRRRPSLTWPEKVLLVFPKTAHHIKITPPSVQGDLSMEQCQQSDQGYQVCEQADSKQWSLPATWCTLWRQVHYPPPCAPPYSCPACTADRVESVQPFTTGPWWL